MDFISIITSLLQAVWPLFSWILLIGPLWIVHVIAGNLFNLFLYISAAITAFYLIMLGYVLIIIKGRKEGERELDFRKAPFVSIHIPTRNELAAINCAKCCLAFDYPKDKMEILIGDDSDNPEVSAKLKEFAKGNKLVKVIKREKNIGYKAGNLNNLIKYSRGEFFAIFDSDYMPQKDFLKRIIEPMVSDKKLTGVQARWNPINTEQNLISILAASITYVFHLISLPFLKSTCGTVTLCGSAEAVRRSDLERMGNWEMGSLTEDIEYSFRLFRENKKVLYLENLECDCEVPFTLKDLYRQQMRWAYGVISALKKHFTKTMFSSKIPFRMKFPMCTAGFGYLATTIFLLLLVMGLITVLSFPVYPTYEGVKQGLIVTLVCLIFTIGPVAASICVLFLKKKVKHIAKLIVSSFSIGILTVYFINIGIVKALLNKPMPWFLVAKNSNNRVLKE